MAESLLKPAVASMASETTAETPAAVSAPEQAVAAPTMPAAVAPADSVPETIAADESVPAGYNSVFIDPTNYGLGATQAPTAQPGGTPSVVFAERSSGCQITVAAGQTSPNAACSSTASTGQGAASSSVGQGEIRVGPIAVSSQGVRLGSTTIVSRAALNEKLRPLNVLRRGNEEYVFPLSVPASISSLFGWRMHPVHQSWRFHSGTDLAAPLGTPVLATQAGRVSVSDFLGGYGLTVILRHGNDNLESRYAHLSQLAVQAGEWVEQGEVIGLVGSTGTSTGPHLHFEMRQLTAEGWAAVDPIEVLEYGVANLLEIIDNPLLALGRDGSEAAATEEDLPTDYPFRPAQPNAS
ncbi:peptidoglycan DD-metalloendopeptidase family protein [Nodosilinea sp. LEGE 07298]|nr:peptidoglycan DD-metalloendopeptidase family protein [Nodosilinea sp. LEGE 07298]